MEIEILNQDRLQTWCARIDLPAAAVAVLSRMAAEIVANPTLAEKFAAFHQKTAVKGEWHREWGPLPFDPEVEDLLGERTSLFYLLAYLAALPYAEREYRRRGIGMDIFRATMLDIRTWFCHEYDLDGRWRFRQFMWIWRHLACELFRLGRLQFMLSPFEWDVRAFRSRVNAEIKLLAGENPILRSDGYALGAGRMKPGDPFYKEGVPQSTETGWNARYEERPDGWLGNPISPYGYVHEETVFLPRSEWELALQAGDTILELHIPRSDPFTLEVCRDSFRQAFAFFKEQAPGNPFKAACCHTWFFTPQLQQILPPESNIVRFQREFYLYPVRGTASFLWNFVFGEKYPSLASAPRDTSLRRAVLDWLESGQEIFDLAGVMFHGPEEWGSQLYMGRQ
jgi:hypothetical protein